MMILPPTPLDKVPSPALRVTSSQPPAPPPPPRWTKEEGLVEGPSRKDDPSPPQSPVNRRTDTSENITVPRAWSVETGYYFSDGVKDLIVAIAHRGRLNLLTLLMKFPAVEMFRKVRASHLITNIHFDLNFTWVFTQLSEYCVIVDERKKGISTKCCR